MSDFDKIRGSKSDWSSEELVFVLNVALLWQDKKQSKYFWNDKLCSDTHLSERGGLLALSI